MRLTLFRCRRAAMFAAVVLALILPASVRAAVVINEIYTAGGNSGATYKTEYYELFNNGGASVSISGWRLEYYFASGTSPNVTITITAGTTLGPGQSYLIAGQTGANGAALPVTPDQTLATLDTNTTGAKFRLADAANVQQDFLGYGGANDAEGGSTRTAPLPTATLSVTRTNGVDTNDNRNDFVQASPSPTALNVPEPSGLGLLGVAGAAALGRRRGRAGR